MSARAAFLDVFFLDFKASYTGLLELGESELCESAGLLELGASSNYCPNMATSLF